VKHSRKQSLNRREALGALGAAGLAFVGACAASPTNPSTTTSGNTGSTSGGSGGGANTTNCIVTPEETAGPYPDRTGMLNNPAFFRRDITEGKPGLPLTLTITLVNAKTNCGPLADAAVEIWQCDASGSYSEYSQPGFNGTGQTFLRGLQTTDSSGKATFATIYPGWYMGRATHIHVEIYVSGRSVKTTQIAFPEDVSGAVYRTGAYATKGQNTTTNARDSVFSDGVQDEMVTLAGDAASGYSATITIGVSV
jgi:protocatechuate 3,4-dioxygenase beta subunit